MDPLGLARQRDVAQGPGGDVHELGVAVELLPSVLDARLVDEQGRGQGVVVSAAGLVAHAPDDDAVGEAEGLGLPDELLLEARGVRGLGGFDDQVADVGGRGLLGPSAAVSVGGLALLDGLAAARSP